MLFSVVPVKVPAAAVTVPDPPKEIEVPLTVNELFARYVLVIAVPFQTPEVIVPTLVREDETTFDAKVVPVKVPAAAVTVPEAPSAIEVPFTVTELLARYALAIAVPFHTPEVIVPTLVREEETTFDAKTVPVNVLAGAITSLPAASVN